MRQAAENLGVDQVREIRGEDWTWMEDGRGEPHLKTEVLERLSPVVREFARGHLGLLSACGQKSPEPSHHVLTASPLLLDLLREGDGAAEVLVGSIAVANQELAARVLSALHRILDAGTTTGTPRVHALSGLYVALTRGMSSALEQLNRFRTARTAVAVDVGVATGGARVPDQSHDELRATH